MRKGVFLLKSNMPVFSITVLVGSCCVRFNFHFDSLHDWKWKSNNLQQRTFRISNLFEHDKMRSPYKLRKRYLKFQG